MHDTRLGGSAPGWCDSCWYRQTLPWEAVSRAQTDESHSGREEGAGLECQAAGPRLAAGPGPLLTSDELSLVPWARGTTKPCQARLVPAPHRRLPHALMRSHIPSSSRASLCPWATQTHDCRCQLPSLVVPISAIRLALNIYLLSEQMNLQIMLTPTPPSLCLSLSPTTLRRNEGTGPNTQVDVCPGTVSAVGLRQVGTPGV